MKMESNAEVVSPVPEASGSDEKVPVPRKKLKRHVSFKDGINPSDLREALENIENKSSESDNKSNGDAEKNEFDETLEDDVFDNSVPKPPQQQEQSETHLEIDEPEDGDESQSKSIIKWKKAIQTLMNLLSTFEKVLFFLGIASAFFLGLITPYVIYSYGTLAEAFIVHARLMKQNEFKTLRNATERTTIATNETFSSTIPFSTSVEFNVTTEVTSEETTGVTSEVTAELTTELTTKLTTEVTTKLTTGLTSEVTTEEKTEDLVNVTSYHEESENNTLFGIKLYKREVDEKDSDGRGDKRNEMLIMHDLLYPETNDFALGMAILGLAAFVLGFTMVVCLSMATESFMYRFRQNVLLCLLHRDLGWFEKRDRKELQDLMAIGLNRFEDSLGENLGMFVCFVTTAIACFLESLIYGWKLSLTLFALLPIFVAAAWWYSKNDIKYSRMYSEECKKMELAVTNTVLSIRTIAAFSGEVLEKLLFAKVVRQIRLIGEKKGWVCGLILGAATLSKHIAFSIGFWYGTKLALESLNVENKQYTTKELYIVLFSAFITSLTISQLIPYVDKIRKAVPASIQALELLQTKSAIDSNSIEGIYPKDVNGKITIDDVCFSYPLQPEATVLSNFNLKVSAGETVAIVGPSKGGKSTILQLLQRFYDPCSGKVTLDGFDLRTLNVSWLRKQVALVESQPILFSTTIRENIRYGRQDATIEEIEAAAKSANAHEFIMKLPQQYDTIVGEHGTILTDSQKQRVAISRALIRDPKILLLDGATAQLDTENAFVVQEALENARRSRTTFIVPHRICSITHIENIVVVTEGRVAEMGNHDDLMEKQGVYYRLIKEEVKNLKPELPEWMDEEDDEVVENVENEIIDRENNDRGRLYPAHRIRINKATNWLYASEFRLRPTLIRLLHSSSSYFFFLSMGLIGALSLGLLFVVFTVVFGHYLGLLAQDVAKITDLSQHYSIVTVVIGFFAGLFAFLQISFFAFFGERVANNYRKQMFDAILHQEMSWFDDPLNSAKALTIRLLNDPLTIQEMLSSTLGKLIQILAMTAAATLITIIYSWKIALVTSLFTILIVFITCLQSKVNEADSALQCSASAAAGKIASESLLHIKTLASLTAENVVCSQYKTALERVHGLALDMFSIRGLLFGIMRCSPLLLYSAVNSLGGYLIMFHRLPHQKVIVIQQLTEAAFFAMAQTVPLVFAIIRGLETTHRIFQLLDRRPRIDSSVNAGFMLPIRSNRSINFECATLAYSTRRLSQNAVHGLTFEIPEGKTTAIVGPRGGGKTTCISLIQRFYDPKEGAVVMDQIDMQNLNVPWLRSQMAIISNDSLLRHRTIGENIAYGDNMRQVKLAEIEQASTTVKLHEFVKSLPKRYDTVLEDCEEKMSILQKLQIACARAILKKPRIILVDDALLTRKPDKAKGLMELLEIIKNGRTCVVTSQSVSAVRSVDWVVVLKNKVLENGTPQDLLDNDTLFNFQWLREEQSQSRRPSIAVMENQEELLEEPEM